MPSSLEELFARTRAGVKRSADLYINMCNIMDRLVKRQEGVAADHARVAMSLQSLTETSNDTYATDDSEVPLLNDGLVAMSKHLRTTQALMEDESKGWDEGVLEDLKRQRDALVSVRELFERRERLDKDNIPYLERRIQTNETKLASLRSKPEGTVKAGEIERVAESIIKVCIRQPCVPLSLLTPGRTRNQSSNSTTAPSSSKSAFVMSSSLSSLRSITSAGGIRTGQAKGSSTPRCWPTTGAGCSTSSRACRWASRVATAEAIATAPCLAFTSFRLRLRSMSRAWKTCTGGVAALSSRPDLRVKRVVSRVVAARRVCGSGVL